jgi:hypothetical protein
MLKASTQNRILKIFEGTKTKKGVKDARKIAQLVGAPRRQVMNFLEQENKADYSVGSYA